MHHQPERNANDGISFAQVGEGGLTEISNIMIRLRELGIQAASDTVGNRERGFIHQEAQSLIQEVDRIANVTTFNGTPLLNAQAPKGNLEFQVGIRNQETDRIIFDANANDVRASSIGIDGLDFQSIDGARSGLDKIDEATNKVFSSRASLEQSKIKCSRQQGTWPFPRKISPLHALVSLIRTWQLKHPSLSAQIYSNPLGFQFWHKPTLLQPRL